MLGGLWFRRKIKSIQVLILAAIIFSIFFITFAAQLRQSSEFRATSSLDLAERARVIAEKATSISIANSIPNPRNLGFALYTHSDPYLFVEPTLSSKPAGNKRLENLKYLWVPRVIMENRPEINDGHLIANEIRNESELYMHDGRYVTFHNVSFGGDLYWRYRWLGVILGSILIGVAYSFVCRIWYSYASLNGSCILLLVTLFPTTFFQGVPLRSISETAWNWFYEFPKYALILLALGFVIDKLFACNKNIVHKMSQPKLSLRNDSLKLFKGALTGRAINFMLNTSMSRILGPEGLGLFSLILSTSQTFEITARCGIDYGLQCELTKNQPQHADEEVGKDIATVAVYWTWLATSFLIILLITWISSFQGLLRQRSSNQQINHNGFFLPSL